MDIITSKEDFEYYQGNFYFQKNDYKRAIKHYKKGLRINSQAILMLYEIGLACFEIKKPKTALKYWKTLLKIAPHSLLAVKINYELDRMKAKRGREEAAREDSALKKQAKNRKSIKPN